jgi:hypothetical protein
MPSRFTLFFRDVSARVWSYLYTRDFHSEGINGFIDIVNTLVLSPVEECRSIHKSDYLGTVGAGAGLWFHTVVLIFRTADDEYRSYRIPTGDRAATYLDTNGIVEPTHPDIVALADYLINSVVCDERGQSLVEFVGGYWAFDDSINQ